MNRKQQIVILKSTKTHLRYIPGTVWEMAKMVLQPSSDEEYNFSDIDYSEIDFSNPEDAGREDLLSMMEEFSLKLCDLENHVQQSKTMLEGILLGEAGE